MGVGIVFRTRGDANGVLRLGVGVAGDERGHRGGNNRTGVVTCACADAPSALEHVHLRGRSVVRRHVDVIHDQANGGRLRGE